ncbi:MULTISPECIES: DUF6197 family protein [Streptomyces]|uniref:DUF6197 family protein n=1 Tax=Streptomyces TaxID=1883 RepID=UPI001EFB88DA|nr:hypothetical protein [Streptomyces sp. CL12-4]MCG8970399.1 hypothetical protein [Streptomyces sp. CL12-4]
MTTALRPRNATPPSPRSENGDSGETFRRGALLVARHGWCQGQGLLYVGSPHAPQAVSLVGALAWAATGDAQSCSPEVQEAMATVRARLDPEGRAAFSDQELLCAWNDTPGRTRDQIVALLLSCRHPTLLFRGRTDVL